MNKPHKHSELIKAWADGEEIEFYDMVCHAWLPTPKNPAWDVGTEYRIKPKPDFNQTMDVYMNKMYAHYPNDFIKKRLMIDNFALLGTMNLTFDGTTGELKSAEVI